LAIIYIGDEMALSDKKKVYNIILEKEVKQKIDDIAKAENRSSSYIINYILKKFIENK
jgi:predicted transcriptional regulator